MDPGGLIKKAQYFAPESIVLLWCQLGLNTRHAVEPLC